jgi:hypothetical protein
VGKSISPEYPNRNSPSLCFALLVNPSVNLAARRTSLLHAISSRDHSDGADSAIRKATRRDQRYAPLRSSTLQLPTLSRHCAGGTSLYERNLFGSGSALGIAGSLIMPSNVCPSPYMATPVPVHPVHDKLLQPGGYLRDAS